MYVYDTASPMYEANHVLLVGPSPSSNKPVRTPVYSHHKPSPMAAYFGYTNPVCIHIAIPRSCRRRRSRLRHALSAIVACLVKKLAAAATNTMMRPKCTMIVTIKTSTRDWERELINNFETGYAPKVKILDSKMVAYYANERLNVPYSTLTAP